MFDAAPGNRVLTIEELAATALLGGFVYPPAVSSGSIGPETIYEKTLPYARTNHSLAEIVSRHLINGYGEAVAYGVNLLDCMGVDYETIASKVTERIKGATISKDASLSRSDTPTTLIFAEYLYVIGHIRRIVGRDYGRLNAGMENESSEAEERCGKERELNGEGEISLQNSRKDSLYNKIMEGIYGLINPALVDLALDELKMEDSFFKEDYTYWYELKAACEGEFFFPNGTVFPSVWFGGRTVNISYYYTTPRHELMSALIPVKDALKDFKEELGEDLFASKGYIKSEESIAGFEREVFGMNEVFRKRFDDFRTRHKKEKREKKFFIRALNVLRRLSGAAN